MEISGHFVLEYYAWRLGLVQNLCKYYWFFLHDFLGLKCPDSPNSHTTEVLRGRNSKCLVYFELFKNYCKLKIWFFEESYGSKKYIILIKKCNVLDEDQKMKHYLKKIKYSTFLLALFWGRSDKKTQRTSLRILENTLGKYFCLCR